MAEKASFKNNNANCWQNSNFEIQESDPASICPLKSKKIECIKIYFFILQNFSDITLSCPTQHKWTFLEAFWLPNSILIRYLHFCDIKFIQVGSDDDHYCWLRPQPKDLFRFIVNFMRIDKKISFWRENSWRILRSLGGLHSYPPHSYCGELDKSIIWKIFC